MNVDYNKKTTNFLTLTNTKINIEFLKNDYHFINDESKRDIYKVTIKRGNREYSFNFGQSLINSTKLVHEKLEREYTMSGYSLKGGYKIIGDVDKYINGSVQGEIKKVKGIPPSEYDILSCLQKHDVGTFEDFCSEFGYDTDSKTADKIYTEICKEFDNVCKLWTDEEIELLR